MFFPGGRANERLAERDAGIYAGVVQQRRKRSPAGKVYQGITLEQRVQKMWDKEVLTPRLTAWYGDRLEEDPIPWTPELLMIKAKVEPLAGVTFNSVLLNYYRDGNDSGRHVYEMSDGLTYALDDENKWTIILETC